jgi:hypothetical protein
MMRPCGGRVLVITCLVVAMLFSWQASAAADDTIVTQAADALRTAWYHDQPSLSPDAVGDARFGRRFYRAIRGQGYAQPLIADGVVFIATNDDWLYGLEPSTGEILWQRSVGPPIDMTRPVPGGAMCSNPSPSNGVLGTPVIDAAAGVAYVVAKRYRDDAQSAAMFELHAVDVTTGDERPGFPVEIAGSAENIPGLAFDPAHHLQRPGLLLRDGVIYAGFGGICDIVPFQGWVFAVDTGGTIEHVWAAAAGGGSIWQSGGALVSDGPGQVLFATGNGETFDGRDVPGPGPGDSPPPGLAQSVVRLDDGPGGLVPVDFFSPWNNVELDGLDADLASSAPMGLPSPYFGTPETPHLLLQDGKSGYLYMLDRDRLGGMGQGPGGSDAVVDRTGPADGVWGAMAAWPGNGGYVYVTGVEHLLAFAYGVDAQGRPQIRLAGTSSDEYGYGSSSPVVTSDGTVDGSALVWGTWCPTGACRGAELRAYGPVPVDGHLQVAWRSPIGIANKFTPPGVAGGNVYVVTRDGHVIGFGPTPPLTVDDVAFGDAVIGDRVTRPIELTASEDVTISELASDDPQLSLDLSGVRLPVHLGTGEQVVVPATYAPAQRGVFAASVTIGTPDGSRSVVATGNALRAAIEPGSEALDLGRVRVGAEAEATLSLRNVGDVPLSIASTALPGSPFAVSGLPAVGSIVAPGASLRATVRFSPTTPGAYDGRLRLRTNLATAEVSLRGVAAPLPVDVPNVSLPLAVVGHPQTSNVTIRANEPTTIERLDSTSEEFVVGQPSQPLPARLAIGESLSVPVSFVPGVRGTASAELVVTTSTGLVRSQLKGRAILAELRALSDAPPFDTFAPGGIATARVRFHVSGEAPLTVSSVHLPGAPFSAVGAPSVGAQLQPDDEFAVDVAFQPILPGQFTDALELVTEAGPVRIALSGDARPTLGGGAGPGLRRTMLRGVSRLRVAVRSASRGRMLRVTFRLGAPVAVVLRIERRRDGACGPRLNCVRYRAVRGRHTVRGRAGANLAMLDVATLAPGRYRVVATPVRGARRGASRSAEFRIG